MYVLILDKRLIKQKGTLKSCFTFFYNSLVPLYSTASNPRRILPQCSDVLLKRTSCFNYNHDLFNICKYFWVSLSSVEYLTCFVSSFSFYLWIPTTFFEVCFNRPFYNHFKTILYFKNVNLNSASTESWIKMGDIEDLGNVQFYAKIWQTNYDAVIPDPL